jgi:hypothetical protein
MKWVNSSPLLTVSEDWALRRYLNMDPLHALFP